MEKNSRLIIITSIFVLIFFAIIAKLFQWQVLNSEKMSILAENQHFITFQIPALRGEILDEDKTPLVKNEVGYLLYANLKNINQSKEKIAREIAKIIINKDSDGKNKDLLMSEEIRIKNIIDTKDAIWVPLAHKISVEAKNQIEKLNIKGLGFEEEKKRFYPEGSMSAHLLGFVGKDINGNDKGYFGLEGYYDLQLRGKDGKLRQEKDAFGRPIIFGETDEIKTKNGRTLVTTIDKSVQLIIEKYLKEGMEKWGAKSGSVTVMDPKSGAILGTASFPSYDPAKFDDYKNNLYENPLVGETFEPGSIIKPIIMSMALQEKKVKPNTRCPKCSGPRRIGEYEISTFNNQYHPNLTMTEVLENSDNTGMVYVGDLLGKETMYNYLIKYGFGEQTGIDLEEEETGTVKPLDKLYPIDAATTTFGQGIAVTQVQMIKAFAVIANGGYLIKPYVVQKIIDQNREINVKPDLGKRILNNEVAKVLSEMLVNVTNKSPLHFPRDLVPGLNKYKISSKSGTAQIPLFGHYDPTKTIGSVVGFAPTENPKFLILVRLIEPTARPWGSDTAGPIFFNITKDLLTYYGINPEL